MLGQGEAVTAARAPGLGVRGGLLRAPHGIPGAAPPCAQSSPVHPACLRTLHLMHSDPTAVQTRPALLVLSALQFTGVALKLRPQTEGLGNLQ